MIRNPHNFNRIRTALVLAAVSALVARAGAQTASPNTSPISLSLAEALKRAESQSLTLQQSRAKLAGADAKLKSAGSLNNPTASLAHGAGQNTGGLDEDILITQTFELGDKRRQRVREARAESAAAAADAAGTHVEMIYNVQSAYYEAARAVAERKLTADSLTDAQSLLRIAQTQFQAGDVPRSNVVRSQIELSRAEQALSVADADLDVRLSTLKSLVGIDASAAVVVTDSATFVKLNLTLESLRSLALRQRSDILSAQSTLKAREAGKHGARAQSQPDLFVEARHSTIDPSVGGNSVRVGVVMPLWDLGKNRADSAVAEAAVREQKAALAETTRLALLDVETAYKNLEQARKQVEAFQTGRLDRSRELLDMARTGYERGASTLLELLDAQQVYRTEQVEYVRAIAAWSAARAALQRAVGGKLP